MGENTSGGSQDREKKRALSGLLDPGKQDITMAGVRKTTPVGDPFSNLVSPDKEGFSSGSDRAGQIIRGLAGAVAGPAAGAVLAIPALLKRFGGKEERANVTGNLTAPGNDSSFRRDLSGRGQATRAQRTSPAQNVPVKASGSDRALATIATPTGEGAKAKNRRLRLSNAKPRRSSVRVDFSATQGATRSGIAVN